MKDSEIMKRTEELDELLKSLYDLQKEKEEIESECKHNIIIVTDNYNCYSVKAMCLFCKRRFESNRELRDYGTILDISEYCFHFGEENVLLRVRDAYDKIVGLNSNLSSFEIANKIKEGLEEEYRETIKQLEEIAKKVREKMETID